MRSSSKPQLPDKATWPEFDKYLHNKAKNELIEALSKYWPKVTLPRYGREAERLLLG